MTEWRDPSKTETSYRKKTYYTISFLMMAYSVVYVLLYLSFVKSGLGIAINAAAFALYALSTFVIAKRSLPAAKITQLCIFTLHLFAVTFAFSTRAGYHFYFILVPVTTFLFFDFDRLWEKVATVVVTVTSTAGFTVCEIYATEVHSPGISDQVFRILFYSDVALIMIALFVALWIFSIALKKMEGQLILLSTTDGLTGAHNRRYFIERAERELERSRRYRNPLAILMIDVDHFKKINDSHGHQKGDKVLKAVVLSCKESTRGTDYFARVGGEEFAALLIDAKTEDAIMIANRIGHKIAELCIAGEGRDIRPTASIGLAIYDDRNETLNDLLRQADAALYRAKENGRNRVELATEE